MDTSLDRYVLKHEIYYEQALNEIKQGKKRSHWMWYIFPQIHGLGESSISRYYAIADANEAISYLEHVYLGSHLMEICHVLLKLDEDDPIIIFGQVDSFKLQSCMTLFLAVSEFALFQKVLDKFYNGKLDGTTMKILKGEI